MINPNKGLTRNPVFMTRLYKELNKEKDGSVQFLTRKFLVKIYRGEQFWQCLFRGAERQILF